MPAAASAAIDATSDPAHDVRMNLLFGARVFGDRACQDASIDVLDRTLALDGEDLELRLTVRDLDAGRIECGLVRMQEGPGFYLMQLLPDGCDPEFFDTCPAGSVAVTASWNVRTFDPTPSCVYVAFASDGRASDCIAAHTTEGDTIVWRLPVSATVGIDTFGPPQTRAYDLAGDVLELSGLTSVQPTSRSFALIDDTATTTVTIPAVG